MVEPTPTTLTPTTLTTPMPTPVVLPLLPVLLLIVFRKVLRGEESSTMKRRVYFCLIRERERVCVSGHERVRRIARKSWRECVRGRWREGVCLRAQKPTRVREDACDVRGVSDPG